MQENQKKNRQEDMTARRKRTLAGIIVLLILGFAVNYFFGDGGQEAGSDTYQTEVTAAPGITQVPEATEEPEATEAPEATDEPEVTEAPEATDEPEVTEAPEATDEPEVTEAPEATDEPEVTEAPETTDEPEVTEVPEATVTVTPTQQPDDPGEEEDSGRKDADAVEILYEFRRDSYLEQHFEKHGEEFDYETKEEYLAGANRVIQSPDALHKIEAEDGDDIYYIEKTNEFVVVSTDGYIRTYFRPSAGIDYYNRQ